MWIAIRGRDADSFALLAMSLTMFCQEERCEIVILLAVVVVVIAVRESPPLERGDLNGRSISRSPETRAAKGKAVYQVLPVGRYLVAAAEEAFLAVFFGEGSDAGEKR